MRFTPQERAIITDIENNPGDRDKYYRVWYVRKHNGGRREISEPCDTLKEIQRTILKSLRKCDTTPEAIAYQWHRRSYIRRLKSTHRNANYILKLDVKEFFPSIKPYHVLKAFTKIKFLARQVSNMGLPLVELCTMTDGLPQGAPTSPTISNLVMRDFDIAMIRFIQDYNVVYTRYADDMHFSMRSIDRQVSKRVMNIMIMKVKNRLRRKGMRLNYDKTRFIDTSSHKALVLGITLNPDSNGICRKKYNQLRGWTNRMLRNSEDVSLDEWKKYQGIMSHIYSIDRDRYEKLIDLRTYVRLKRFSMRDGRPLAIPRPRDPQEIPQRETNTYILR